ncbi:hypothetical protein D3C81_1170070 [compost metagenome]
MKPSIDQELGQLELELREPLRQAVLPPPSPSETAALIAALQPEFDLLKTESAYATLDFNPQVEAPSLMKLLWNQFRIYRKSLILIGSFVFLMMILLVDPKRPMDSIMLVGFEATSLFPVFTPLLIMVSMLFGSRTSDRGMRNVESITPYPPALVMYSRMLMVIGLVVGWALISSIVVGLRVSAEGAVTLPFIPFLLQWLGISLLVGGVLMYVMFRKGIKMALFFSAVIYVGWFLIEDFMPLLSMRSKSALDTLMLITGVLLILGSYYRSRNMRVSSPGRRR